MTTMKAELQDPYFSLSLPVTFPCSQQDLSVINPVFPKFPDDDAEVHLAFLVRTTRAGSVPTLAPVGDMCVGAHHRQDGPSECPRPCPVGTGRLRPMGQNSMVVP